MEVRAATTPRSVSCECEAPCHRRLREHILPLCYPCAHFTEKGNRAKCGEGTATHRPALQRRVASPQTIVPFICDHLAPVLGSPMVPRM